MTANLINAIRLGGVLQLGILIASASVPGALDWKAQLRRLSPLSRQVVWVHGVFIVLVIIAFGALSLGLAPALADHSALARSICGFIAFFWLARLGVQFFVFDAKPVLRRSPWVLRLGYHALTVVFTCLVLIYGVAAIH